MLGREHHPEGRQRDIERAVMEGQGFGVGHFEADAQAFGPGPVGAARQQFPHVVGGGDVGEATRRRQGGIAVAGGDVEHEFAGADIGGLGQGFADDLQGRADHGEVAAGPGGLLAFLDGDEVGRGQGDAAGQFAGSDMAVPEVGVRIGRRLRAGLIQAGRAIAGA